MASIWLMFLPIIEIIICLAGLIFSLFKINKREVSTYCIFLFLITASYILEEVCAIVYGLCDNINLSGYFQASLIGYFATLLFGFTASFGVIEKEIKKDKITKKVHLISLIAPIVCLIVYAICFAICLNTQNASSIISLTLMLFLVIPGSFYSLKHVLLKNYNEKLKLTFPTNLILTIFYLFNLLYIIFYLILPIEYSAIVNFISGLLIASLPILSIKENNK